jgi:hypothetical protein
MRPLVILVILGLAAARIGRLVTDDVITLPIRAWITRRWGTKSKITYLVHCDWCSGLWVAGILVAFAWTTGLIEKWAMAAILVPAVAYMAAILRKTEKP